MTACVGRPNCRLKTFVILYVEVGFPPPVQSAIPSQAALSHIGLPRMSSHPSSCNKSMRRECRPATRNLGYQLPPEVRDSVPKREAKLPNPEADPQTAAKPCSEPLSTALAYAWQVVVIQRVNDKHGREEPRPVSLVSLPVLPPPLKRPQTAQRVRKDQEEREAFHPCLEETGASCEQVWVGKEDARKGIASRRAEGPVRPGLPRLLAISSGTHVRLGTTLKTGMAGYVQEQNCVQASRARRGMAWRFRNG